MDSCTSLPRLNTASTFEDTQNETEPEEVHVNYKTGASFVGHVKNHMKVGKGIFTWPNGSQYEGSFVENLRHGKGVQIWPDGSRYEGLFVDDLRHGHGHLEWVNGESYEGSFFRDRRHGPGTYRWPDGSKYVGRFYMDRKEGYGVFTFANRDKFEGLYIEDEREGPGIMTYPNGCQDVGLWYGEKLVQISSVTKNAFTLKKHKEFEFHAKEHTMFLDFEEEKIMPIFTAETDTCSSNISGDTLLREKISDLYSEALDPRSLAINKETFDDDFFRNSKKDSKADANKPIKVWNKTPSMIRIQKSVHKHRGRASEVSFDVNNIIKGNRSPFKEKGPLELASEEYLMAAMNGESQTVEDLLTSGHVHPDVADFKGHTALIGATVNWHMDIINIILNHGGDVNKVNNEGSSPLSAGIIFFYPIDCFRYNVAERYLKRPPTVVLVEDPSKETPSDKLPFGNERRTSLMNIAKQQKLSDTDKLGVSVASIDSGIPNMDSNPTEKSDKSPVTIAEEDEVNDKGDRESLLSKDERDSLLESETDKQVEEDLQAIQMPEDFESNQRMYDYKIEVSDQLVERCATQLSTNERVVSRQSRKHSAGLGTARLLAIQMSIQEDMKKTLDLLLRRGANPNASGVPMPVLFFAIKAADVEMVKTLLMKGASTATHLPKERGSLTPLHIASAIPGEEGVQITELLLDALADPDARAEKDDSFLNRMLEEEWSKDVISAESKAILGGRTALQIACSRDDNYKQAACTVHLLLEHKANPNLLCNGFSPLALAIASGNDLAIDELLNYGADPSLSLTHGVGSALCVATSTEYEHRRGINVRIQLLDKLIKAGADILAPIPIGPKRVIGTAVDYAYYMYNQDRRIAHMPYHALTHAERETYNARRKLLAHFGAILRTKAVQRERRRMQEESQQGLRSGSPSSAFVYVGAGAVMPPGTRSKQAIRLGQVTFGAGSKAELLDLKRRCDSEVRHRTVKMLYLRDVSHFKIKRTRKKDVPRLSIRKPLFKYCYECGRSVFVRLSACTRCKEVFYCSKACKLKAWNARHKDECIRVGGRSRSASPNRKGDSPTPTTHADKDHKTSLLDLKGSKVLVPLHGLSKSASGAREVAGELIGISRSAKDPREAFTGQVVFPNRGAKGGRGEHMSRKDGFGTKLGHRHGGGGGISHPLPGQPGFIDNYSFE